MKLTGNALSMLLKRYRAVLVKCRTLNWLAGMVLAGGIVLGGVSGALATETQGPLIWGQGTGTAETPADNPKTDNWGTRPLFIQNGAYVNITGATTPTMTEGGAGRGGSYLVISGGTVNITGSAEGATLDTSSLYGYGGGANPSAAGYEPRFNEITGGTITITKGVLGSSQNAGTGGANPKSGLKISGGQIIFDGSSSGLAATLNVQSLTIPESGGKLAGPSNMIITGGTITAKADKVGYIQGWNTQVDFSGGQIIAEGVLNLVSRQSEVTSPTDVTTTWNMSGNANITVKSGGTLGIGVAGTNTNAAYAAPNLVLNVNGGTLNNEGTIDLRGTINLNGGTIINTNAVTKYIGVLSDKTVKGAAALNINSGNFTLQQKADPSTAGTTQANFSVRQLSISGGTVTIDGGSYVRGGGEGTTDTTSGVNWGSVGLFGYNAKIESSNFAEASSNGTLISGGNITVTNAVLGGHQEVASGSAPGLNIVGGNITLAGSTAQTAGILHGTPSVIISGGNINVAQGNYGVILAKGNASAATITISSGANITVNGQLTLAPTPNAGRAQYSGEKNWNIDYSLSQSTKTGSATMSGGTLAVNPGGTLVIGKGLTFNYTGGNFSLASGSTLLNNQSLVVANNMHLNLTEVEVDDASTGSFVAGNASTSGHIKFSEDNFKNALTAGWVATDGGLVSVTGDVELANSDILAATSPTAPTAGQLALTGTKGTFAAQTLTITGIAASGTTIGGASGTGIVANVLNLQTNDGVTNAAPTISNTTIYLNGDKAQFNGTNIGTVTVGSGLIIGQSNFKSVAGISGPTSATVNVALKTSGAAPIKVVDGASATFNKAITVDTGSTSGVVVEGVGSKATFNKDVTVSVANGFSVGAGSTATFAKTGTTAPVLAMGTSGTGTVDGILDIKQATITSSGSSVKPLVVNEGGVVDATLGSFGISAVTDSITAVKAMDTKAGSVVKLNLADGTQVTTAQINTLNTTIGTGAGNGMLDLGGATIDGITSEINAETGKIAGDKLASLTSNVTTTALSSAIVTGVSDQGQVGSSVNLTGGYKGVELAATTDPDNPVNTLTLGANLTLLGSEGTGNMLVAQTNGDSEATDVAAIKINDNITLTVGSSSQNNSGSAGAVTMVKSSANGTMNVLGNGANAGTPTVTNFTFGALTGEGDVNVSGTNVVFNGIGSEGTAFAGTLTVANGTVWAKGPGAAQAALALDEEIAPLAAGDINTPDQAIIETKISLTGNGTVIGESVNVTDELTATGSGNLLKSTDGAITVENAVAIVAGNQLTIQSNGKDNVGDIELKSGSTNLGTLEIIANNGSVKATGTNAGLQATSIKATAGDKGDGDISTNGDGTITSPVINAAGTITTKGITADGASAGTPVNVTANQLTIGDSGVDIDGTGSANDVFEIANDGTDVESTITGNMDLKDVNTTVMNGKLTTSGTNTIDGGSFTALKGTTVKFGDTAGTDDTTIKGGATANYDTLITGSALKIGDGDAVGTTTSVGVNKLQLGGALTVGNSTTNAPTQMAVEMFSSDGTKSDGKPGQNITVSNGSYFTYGNNDPAYAMQQLNAAKANDITPAADAPVMVVAKPLNMDSSTLTVGTSGIASNAVLIVDAAAAKPGSGASDPQGAITYATSQTAPVAGAGAQLYLPGAKAGENYAVFAGASNAAAANVAITQKAYTDSSLVTIAPANATTGLITPEAADMSGLYPNLDPSLQSALKAAVDAKQVPNMDSEVKGVRFLSRATAAAGSYLNGNADLATQTIEGAARMVTIGAVPQMTRTANQAAAEAVTQRTSMAIPSSIQTQQATDRVALWIMPLYQSTNGARLEAGNFDADYHGGLGGIALGADYTFANAIRAGIAFNIGAGYATGGGDFADTTNNMNFWGLGAYAGWTGNNIGVSADVNFTSAYNKLTQDLPQSMGMRDLKADVRSYAFSTGLRGEYKLETSAVDITPHVGVRFMYLTTDDYKVKSEGTVLKGDGLHQNIWTFPIGVSFSKNIERSNGWHVKPMLDLAVVPAAGDIKAKENVRFSGTDYKAELETQVMDYITYQGVLGLEVGNQNLTFGLSGNTQFGEKTSGYGVLGSFRYEF